MQELFLKKWIVKDFLVTLGGEQHKGWLPANASTPLSIPVRTLSLDFTILEEAESGFILFYESQNGELHGDTWHQSKAEAIEAAKNWFGISVEQWQEVKEK